MANRYAPYKAKYMAREVKKVLAKFTTSNAAAQELTMASTPYNIGVYDISHTATGVYKFSLGSTSTSVDTYAGLAGAHCTFSEANRQGIVTNDQSSNATTPFVEITVCSNSAATVNVANTKTMHVEFTFLDSSD